QYAKLAQRQPAGEVDRIDLGAELAQLLRALLRDDDADQETHHADDRQGGHADQLELPYQRPIWEPLGTQYRLAHGDQSLAQKADDRQPALGEVDHLLAGGRGDALEGREARRLDRRGAGAVARGFEQLDYLSARAGELRPVFIEE